MTRKIWLVPFVLFASVAVAFLPTNAAFAIGWEWDLGFYDHWGSSSCTTSYPNMNFVVNQTYGTADLEIQRLANGSWQPVKVDSLDSVGKRTFTVPAQSGVNYRVYIESRGIGSEGKVEKCYGSW